MVTTYPKMPTIAIKKLSTLSLVAEPPQANPPIAMIRMVFVFSRIVTPTGPILSVMCMQETFRTQVKKPLCALLDLRS